MVIGSSGGRWPPIVHQEHPEGYGGAWDGVEARHRVRLLRLADLQAST